MSNFYTEDYLMHHGVLGMKWGVKHASNMYSKATTSEGKVAAATKMQKEYSKDLKKLNKLTKKADKALTKAVKAKYGLFGSQEKYDKKKLKADKKAYKAQKWYNSMSNTFSQQSLVSISDKDKSAGEKYLKYFEQKSEISKYNH